VLYRDLYVTWRELPAFLAQVILQPLFLLFVFGKVLSTLNYTQNNYTELLFPGLRALVGAGFGLLMGTLVQPQRINLLFSLIFTPLLFTGCSQYPWPQLHRIRWFQIVTACNPMTYVSEAMRGALVPDLVPHIAPWICLVMLIGSVSVLLSVGLKGFYRRAID
jgi:ABC-2 type transport system permease protein